MYKAYKKSKVVYREKVGHCLGCKHWKKKSIKHYRLRSCFTNFFDDMSDEVLEEYWGRCERIGIETGYNFFCGAFKKNSKIFYK